MTGRTGARRGRRIVVWCLVCATAGGLLVALMAPKVVSAVLARRLISEIAARGAGHATLKSLALTWGGDLTLRGLTVEQHGLTTFSCAELRGKVSIADALAGDVVFRAVVADPVLLVNRAEPGGIGLPFVDAIRSRRREAPPPGPATPPSHPADPTTIALPRVRGELSVRRARFVWAAAGRPPHILMQSAADVRISALDEPIEFAWRDDTHDDAQNAFEVSGDLQLASGGRFDFSEMGGNLTYVVRDFALDPWTPLVSALAAGSRVTGRLNAEGSYRLTAGLDLTGRGTLRLDSFRIDRPDQAPVVVSNAGWGHQSAPAADGGNRHTVTFTVDDYLSGGTALTIRRDSSGEYTANASSDLRADIAGITRALGDTLPVQAGVHLEGQADARSTVEIAWSAAGLRGVSLRNSGRLTELRVRDAESRRVPIDPEIELTTEAAFRPGKRIDLEQISVRAEGVELNARGGVNLETRTFDASRLSAQVDLDTVAEKLRRIFAFDLPVRGSVRANLDLAGAADGADVTGVLHFQNLRFENAEPSVSSADETLELAGRVQFDPERTDTVQLRKGTLRGAGVDFRWAGEATLRPQQSARTSLQLAGTIEPSTLRDRWRGLLGSYRVAGEELTVDARMTLVAPTIAIEMEVATGRVEIQLPRGPNVSIGGLASGSYQWREQAEGWALDGKTEFEGLRLRVPIGATESSLDEPRLLATSRVSFDRGARTFQLHTLTIESELLDGDVTGAIAAFPASPELRGVTASFSYHPERLARLLKPWLPGELRGTEPRAARLELSGSFANLESAVLLAGLRGEATLDLPGFEWQGLTGQGHATVNITPGNFRAQAELDLNEGQATLGAVLDPGSGPDARSSVTATFDRVAANPRMAAILGKFHPIFAVAHGTTRAEFDGLLVGNVTLAYHAPLDPWIVKDWARAAKEPFEGKGHLEVHDFTVRGSPLLLEVLRILHVERPQKIELNPVDFTIRRGRVYYDRPAQLKIDGHKTFWTGSVGFDETLDLLWEVPIDERLVEKERALEHVPGGKIEIPVRGTARRPEVKWAEVVSRFAREGITQGIEDLLGAGSDNDQARRLLERADRLYDAGNREDAGNLYREIRQKYRDTLTYKLNRSRIKDRGD